MSDVRDFQSDANLDPPRKKGMSGALKIILLLLGLFAVLGVVCCGVVVWVFFSNVTTDPAKVSEMSDSIVTMQIPDYWEPVMGLNIVVIRMVFYQNGNADGVLVLMEAAEDKFQNREEFEIQARMSITEQMNQQGNTVESTTVIRSEHHNYSIRGEDVEFEFVVTEGDESGREFYEVTGIFDGNKHTVFLYMKAPSEDIDQESIAGMLESIE